jgi:hypothetical protein
MSLELTDGTRFSRLRPILNRSGNIVKRSVSRSATLGVLFPNSEGGDRRLRVSRRVRVEADVFPGTYRTGGQQSAHVFIIGSRQVSKTVTLVYASFRKIELSMAFASPSECFGPDHQF